MTPKEYRGYRSSDTSLLDVYFGGKIDQISRDAESRAEHYGSEALEVIDHVKRGIAVPQHRLNDLVLQFMRRTSAAKKTREVVNRLTKPEAEEIPSFEDQEAFSDGIRII